MFEKNVLSGEKYCTPECQIQWGTLLIDFVFPSFHFC